MGNIFFEPQNEKFTSLVEFWLFKALLANHSILVKAYPECIRLWKSKLLQYYDKFSPSLSINTHTQNTHTNSKNSHNFHTNLYSVVDITNKW